MKNTECPYCKKEININHDNNYGYEEDKLHQQQCHYCDKIFIFTTYICFSHQTYKADCLNGEEHQFEKAVTYKCKTCGEEKPIVGHPNEYGHPSEYPEKGK